MKVRYDVARGSFVADDGLIVAFGTVADELNYLEGLAVRLASENAANRASLRDEFAKAALHFCLQDECEGRVWSDSDVAEAAKIAYVIADAMLKARG